MPTGRTSRGLGRYQRPDAHGARGVAQHLADVGGADLGVRCWYVNLQAPLVRTSRGFDTSDKALDVVIAPNGEHRWKDEDHLERAVDVGWISAADARRVRSEGERVIERAARREYPFDGELISWRPDPAWPIPELPPGWAATAGSRVFRVSCWRDRGRCDRGGCMAHPSGGQREPSGACRWR